MSIAECRESTRNADLFWMLSCKFALILPKNEKWFRTMTFFPVRTKGDPLSGASSLTSTTGIVEPTWIGWGDKIEEARLCAADARAADAIPGVKVRN